MVAASSFEQLALHQTDPTELHKDGSIKGMGGRKTTREKVVHLHDSFSHSYLCLLFSLPAEDICLFLSSRYGIVTNDELFTATLQGSGGAVELVVILLIPALIKDVDHQ
jgi:hypothetical protein